MRLPVKISCFLFRKKDGVYQTALFKRTQDRGGNWQQITGGYEESDESLIFAVKRELSEEAFVNESDIISISGPIGHFQYLRKNDGLWVTEYVYGAILKENTAITIEQNPELEHTECGWFNLDEAKEMLQFGVEYLNTLEKNLN